MGLLMRPRAQPRMQFGLHEVQRHPVFARDALQCLKPRSSSTPGRDASFSR